MPLPPNFWLLHILNILWPFVPFVAGTIRYKKMDPAYHGLVFIFASATVAETIRTIALYYFYSTNIASYNTHSSYNVYVLIIGILYTHLFFKLGIFESKKWLYYLILALLPLLWIWDHFIFKGFKFHSSTIIYRVFYALLLCFYSIQQINRLLVTERNNLLKNASFLICFCLLVYFLPYIITRGIYLFGFNVSETFYKSVALYTSFANPVTYLIFTLAILWIPPKKKFIQLS